MSTDAFPLVDVAEIVRLVGRPSFDRGRAYARGPEVLDVLWNSESLELEGIVQGSDVKPYHCRIPLTERGGRLRVELEALCSCPVGFNCKHVAATLLASNMHHLREDADSTGLTAARELPPPTVDSAPERAAAPASGPGQWATDELVQWFPAQPRRRPAAVREPVDWRTAVGSLVGEAPHDAATNAPAPGGRGGRGRASTEPTPMALQFEVREFVARTREHWRGPQSQTARLWSGAEADRPTRRLGVRPVVRNHVGTFVKANVSWASFTHQVNRLNLDPAHLHWFAQFAGLYRATREPYLGQEVDWLYLDDFASPLLWNLLDEAAEVGIELRTTKKSTSIRIGESAAVRLEATASPDASVRLEPVVTIDRSDVSTADSGTIADHGVYSYQLGSSIVLARLAPAARLTAEVRALIGSPATISVPSSDVDEFFDTYLPRLRRSIGVVSTDETVQLPREVLPVLVLACRFRPKNVVQLEWQWEYAGARRTEHYAVDAAGPVSDAASASANRDPGAEHLLQARVTRVLQQLVDETDIDPRVESFDALVLQGYDAALFSDKALPALEAVPGVRLHLTGTRPQYRELSGDPELTITTVESDKRDWFDLGIVINLNGYRIPFAPLLKALSRKQKKLLMVDKTYLTLDHPVFERLRELLDEAAQLDEWQTGVRINRYQTDLWSEFEDLAEETVQAVAWRESLAGLQQLANFESGSTEFGAVSTDSGTGDTLLASQGAATDVWRAPLPSGVDATLRPYQLEGYQWLALLHRHGLGGVLADDMGLGKTLQTLSLIAHARAEASERVDGPFLVVAPTSVVSNWVNEAHRFTPNLAVRAVTSTQAKSAASLAELAEGADVVVTSYTLFRLDQVAYRALPWSGLVLDEAQFVKNHTSKLHRCAKDFDAPFKLAITGTPLENNLMELWALFDITAPGLFASARKFTETYVRPLERGLDSDLLARLRLRIRPFLMRRTKELVAPELPPKQEQRLDIALAPSHRALYDTYFQRERQKLLGLIDDLDRNRLIVFRSLTLLRLLSLDASLIDAKYSAIPSAKLDALVEQLADVVAEGHRALVFSQFTSFLGKAAERFTLAGITFEYLDGSTRKRAEVIERFKGGTASVFLISLKAGGFGLNLTEADYVFLLDPWWNPASESQAIDRTHRIGQRQSVNVYRLVASDTIEEKVMALKEKKSQLFDAVLDDDAAFSTALSADDIRGLLVD